MLPNLSLQLPSKMPLPTGVSQLARPIQALTPTSFIDSLPLFNVNWMTDQQLDLARELLNSGEYYFIGRQFPIPQDGDTIFAVNNNVPQGTTNVGSVIGPSQSVGGSLALPSYSYIVSIACDFYTFGNPDHNPSTNPGFYLSLADKGAKQDIFDKRFARDITFGSTRSTYSDMTDNVPMQQFFNLLPWMLLPPGLLQWQVTNLDTTCAQISVYITFAVPINAGSLNKHEVNPVQVDSTSDSISNQGG